MLSSFRYRNICVAAILLIGSFSTSKEPIPPAMVDVANNFNLAIKDGNFEALVKYIKFPIKSNEYGKIANKTRLKSIYSKIFTKERIKGLYGQRPSHTPDGGFSISSSDEGDPIRFLFTKVGLDYKMYCIDNVNE